MDTTPSISVGLYGNRCVRKRHIVLLFLCIATFALWMIYFYLGPQVEPILSKIIRSISLPVEFGNLEKCISNYDTNVSRRCALLLSSMYKRRLLMHLEAGFSPQIAGSHLFLYIRPQQFLHNIASVEWLPQVSSKVINLLIFCYEPPLTLALCNISLTVLLSKNETFKLINFKAGSSSQTSYTLSDTQKYNDTIKICVSFRVSEEKSYRFMYQIHDVQTRVADTERKFLHWPLWPLTTDCAHRHLQQLLLDQDRIAFDDDLGKSCSTSSVLVVVSPHQAFEMERSTISSWLDVQYQASSPDMLVANRRRNKHAFETVLNSSVCPLAFQNWILEYRHWHARISRQISKPYKNFSELRDCILKENVRFMVNVHFDSGVADKFLHIISTYLVAVLTRRFFVFGDGWSDLHDVMRLSLASEQENVAPWLSRLASINEDLPLNHTDYITQRLVIFRLERIFSEFDYEKSFPERILLFKSHVGNVIHTLTSSTSIYRQFLQLNLSLTPANIYGCLYHSLMVPHLSTLLGTTLVPESTVIHNTDIFYKPQEILQLLLSSRYYPIGIQIRTGDHVMLEKINASVLLQHWPNNTFMSDFGGFFSCAHQLIHAYISNDTNRAPFVYLISDSHLLRQQALIMWPFYRTHSNTSVHKTMQVVTSPDLVKHITYTQNSLQALRQAIYDAFLFSSCEQHIITTKSGFGRFAAFASLKGKNIFTLEAGEHPTCKIGINLTEAGHHYSGIR